jgi:hypothetical protein
MLYNLLNCLHEMKLDAVVSEYSEFRGIVTVITRSFADESFLSGFNLWNESSGIEYSTVKVNSGVFIIYLKNNNGVQITDLTR